MEEITKQTRHICELLSKRQAVDIVALDVSSLTSIADYFVIATARNNNHIHGLAGELIKLSKDLGFNFFHKEGSDNATWLLLDFGAIVVHLFLGDTRDYYQLEKLWFDAKKLSVDQVN